MKNLFTINPDAPFLDVLAAEMWRQAEGDGFRLSRTLVFLPTRRACRQLGLAFARVAKGKPVLLPRLRPLGDIDEEEIGFAAEGAFDLPHAIAPLKRLMLLAQLVRKRDPSLSWDQAAEGAAALARFLDQVQIEQCDVSALPTLVEERELAAHWQEIIAFLDIVTRTWPLVLKEEGCLDPALRRNLILNEQARLWRETPPDFPVIAAGSTGSVPATAALLDVIAGLDWGAVILPGLDRAMEEDAWDAVDDTHPQYGMKRLLARMGVSRNAVRDWGEAQPLSPRAQLLTETMRPASVTESWRNLRGKLDRASVAGLSRLTLAHPQEEAQVIALRLRACLETPDKTATFVTPDRGLAMRVASLLRRWGIEADDSGGTPLSFLPIGAFCALLLKAAAPHAGAVDALALLKHPLAACGQSPAACRVQARKAELRARKGKETEDFAFLQDLLKPLSEIWSTEQTLEVWIATHIRVAETIAATDLETGAVRLWCGAAGEALAEWLTTWRETAPSFPLLKGQDYAALFHFLIGLETIRPPLPTHPRLTILGAMEARLCAADLVILGGLNEGLWPPDPGFDPWMSRAMREKFSLPAPEYRIGLSAHDFAQMACAKEVMMTRALRAGGTPTVPSRFWLRLEAVLSAAGLSDTLTSDQQWQAWAQALDRPPSLMPCARPAPLPPVALRPKALSVTEITTWLRNPYAIYAKHVLKLRKLDPLDAELDAGDKGDIIHLAFEKFTKAFPNPCGSDAMETLLTYGRDVFNQAEPNPRARVFWWARFTDMAAWFLETQRKRYASGIRLAGAELEGIITLNGDFRLKGRADRIDFLEEGGLAVVDYKTGGVPAKGEMRAGLEPQLQLLALIAQQGGFGEFPATPSGSLEYWILKGGASGCKIQTETQNLDSLVAQAEAGLENLIATFNNPHIPYTAIPRARFAPDFDDYAHLARLAEWGQSES